ncbi:MAG TPA: polymer-forming cytoskeletal protein [Gemmatimonadota bacterium]|jgi:cytoskeletal protein CcmA (bactofilin family)
MALWKEAHQAEKEPVPAPGAKPPRENPSFAAAAPTPEPTVRPKARESEQSVIAANIAIEGKIEGSGHVRLVGKFKGDVNVEGDVTIEPGAKVTGSVRASRVIIGGELEGNVDAASSVELLQTGMVTGDLRAGSVTIAAGSRMRGQAEFGWDDKEVRGARMKVESGARP